MRCFAGRMQLFIVICVLLIELCVCGKYSKEANLNNPDGTDIDFKNEENPFRMQKTNLLWAKGKKLLSEGKLADLYTELKIHDKHETHLKKLRADNLDKDGAMEAKVLINYRRVVEHYGLDPGSPSNAYTSNDIPVEDDEKKKSYFQDPKLQTMWRKAEQSGFSEKDLNMLREEFWHQQMKVNEFDFVHREKDILPDPIDNTIDRENLKIKVPPTEARDRKEAMKKDKKDIKEGYMKLEHLVSSIPSSEPTFKDSRVFKLWEMAKQTNWTDEELNGFKQELLHFEHRLNKQDYFQKQLELSSELLDDLGETGEVPESHRVLEEKSKNLSKKIKKLHTHFKTRLDQALKHSEL